MESTGAMLRGCATLLSLAVAIRANMEGYIVGGSFVKIVRYPHSAFLTVSCAKTYAEQSNWICGASVVNQHILLTAGHCLYGCTPESHITVNLGDENRQRGVKRSTSRFRIHENYDARTSSHDIALLKLFKPVIFNSRISRVALMENGPYKEMAFIAGWGLVEEETKEQSVHLKYISQKILTHDVCVNLFGDLPKGTICASNVNNTGFPAQGDSGSALVVRGYIQLGLVSYKVPVVAPSVIIYTDVGYFYSWIKQTATRLHCLTT